MYTQLCRRIKKVYYTVAENRFMASAFFGAYLGINKLRNKECRQSRFKGVPHRETTGDAKSSLKELRVATICDDMTWQNLKRECNAYAVTPGNWKQVLFTQKLDVFFCESAWYGLTEHRGCWHGKIYRNHKLLFENRKELLAILEFCRKQQIPTVFWNKEDPTYFDSERHDFKDTALKFDYVFTTARECVEHYNRLGHHKVGVLPFGFSPQLFHPLNCYVKENKAVFAGSWYGENENRCRDLSAIFDEVLRNNIPLYIYDRQSGTQRELRKFPEKYQKYVKPSVTYEELGQELKTAKYAINVNTATGSDTMFARRVLEFMAMNTIVISNESVGMRKAFPDSVIFLGDKVNMEDMEKRTLLNMEYAFRNFTNNQLFLEAFQKVGVLAQKECPKIAVVLMQPEGGAEDITRSRTEVESPWYKVEKVRQQEFCPEDMQNFAYGYLCGSQADIPDFSLFLPHFSYLPSGCGIRGAEGNGFEIQEDCTNRGVLFPKDVFCTVLEQPELRTQKYLLGLHAERA